MHGWQRRYDQFLEFCGEIPGYIVCAIALGICLDVILRNIGLGGIEWMLETVEYGLYALTFVGAAFVLRIGRHVTVDVIITLLPPRPRRWVAIFAGSIMLLVNLTFLYYGARVTWSAFQDNSLLIKTYTIPEWWLLALLPPAALLLSIESGRWLREAWNTPTGGTKAGRNLDGI